MHSCNCTPLKERFNYLNTPTVELIKKTFSYLSTNDYLLLADLIPRAVHNHYHPYLNRRRHQHYLQYQFALKIFFFWLLRRLGAVGMGVHHQDQCFRLIDCQRIFQSMKCWNEENRRVNKHYQENILASYFTPKKNIMQLLAVYYEKSEEICIQNV
jgi:hypothetical protein